MYNLGPIAFPMTRAYVYTLLPSLSSSSKLAGAGDVIGTFLQDRATAIAGRLGAGPEPVHRPDRRERIRARLGDEDAHGGGRARRPDGDAVEDRL